MVEKLWYVAEKSTVSGLKWHLSPKLENEN